MTTAIAVATADGLSASSTGAPVAHIVEGQLEIVGGRVQRLAARCPGAEVYDPNPIAHRQPLDRYSPVIR